MATKPDEIDLNADAAAVSLERENEGHSLVVGASSVAETLTESIDGQGQLLDSVVDKGRVSDSAKVISDLNIDGLDVNMISEVVEGKVGSENLDRLVNTDAGEVVCDLNFSGDDVNTSSEDVLDKAINVKTENEPLDSGVDASTEETVVRCENDVSTRNQNEAVAERASGAVEMDQNLNVDLVREELEQETNTTKNSSSFDGDTSKSLPHKASQVAERASGEVEMDQEIQDMNVGLVREELELGTNVTMSSSSFDVDTCRSLPHKSAQVAERASGEVVMDQEMNVSPVREELEQGTNMTMNTSSFYGDTSQSSPQKSFQVAGRASGEVEMDQNMNVNLVREESVEGTNVSMNSSLLNRDTSQSLPHKSDATSDVLEKQTMELDTQLESRENQLIDVHVSGAGTISDALNELCTVNLVVDLSPCTTIDGRVSGNLNTGSVSSKHEFCVGDLVWGKVRGHPWWPGQIFDLSWASQKATKYFKKDSYLIAYFEDQTFAWNEVSKIKHFREHFPQMEKQSSLADFHYAVDHALEEVSRRVEYGLACPCIPEEALIEVNTQVIDNAGIRKELNLRKGGDSFSDAVSFDPVKLCEKVKALAQLPYPGGADRLELVTVNAQLSAFYRWKGYFQMPVFHTYAGLLESDAEIPLSRKVEHSAEVTQNAAPHLKHNKQVSPGMGKLKSEDGSSHKRKHIAGDNIHPSKKEKTLMDLLAERHANMSNGKGNNKLISPSSGKKRKAVLSISDDLAVKHEKIDSGCGDVAVKHEKIDPGYGDVAVKHKKLDSISDVVTVKKSDMLAVEHGKSNLSIRAANKCLPIKKTFGVGSSILKVASQLNGTNSLLKCGDGTAQTTADKIKLKEKSISQKSESKQLLPVEESSPDELLSQLCLTAQDPMKGHNFSISLISFLSEFRNSVSLDKQSLEEDYSDKIGKTLTKSETTETSELELMNNCYWTDRVLESTPEEQQSLENKSEVGEVLHENPSQLDIPAKLESGPKFVGESLESEEVQPLDSFDGCHNEDPSPTALILNFTDLDSVPSKENLNKIFSRFGPLNELETEVLKSKRAKVVFKRRADAETAFSSAGKYSIFGPSLVSYCLKYMSSNAPKRSRKTATSVE
ncbi:hypothetical protein Dsin_007519 [Dipteronia sinensis]|uniref:PWWP domain-containing protein n=1 Tax=Dipteronia sinensis TaxID=43782 RepID=A0AAE0B0Q1_9ROSI|nr:hypothetical protein Dsin_007519 [Dipteronia sinensis]